jgi:serine/threonine protein kinase
VVKRAAKQEQASKQAMHELTLWSTLYDHPNVAMLVDVGREFGVPVLITPFADCGNLEDYILSQQSDEMDCGGGVAWVQGPLSWMLQLSYGLQFLHDQRVIHGDVKPRNLLVYPPPGGEAFPRVKVIPQNPT